MNTETDYLKSIAEEIVNNKTNHSAKPDQHLLVEARRLEKAIIYSLNTSENFTQRDTFHFNTFGKLVNICDILFDVAGDVNPDVMVLMELLDAASQAIPDEIRPNLKLPKAFVAMQKFDFTEYSSIMLEQGISKKLIDIAGIPFRRFIQSKNTLYCGDFTWLRGYKAKLDIMDWEDLDGNSPEEALLSLLVVRDFNDDRFYNYCKKYIQERTAAVNGKRKRLMEFAKCKKLVLQDTQAGMPSFDLHANSVSRRLLKWIVEEIDFVETHEREQPYAKLHFYLYVNRIAFFFKLLSEQKVFGDTSFKELSQQVAGSCLSMDGEEILPGTIISKAYPKDQKMLEEMESLLANMLGYVRSFMRKK